MSNNTASRVKFLSFYLPQYHPIPENDRWWGKGFTDWRNVVNSRPRFHGHNQPQIPADLGFYDLRLEETRIAQAEMANEYGIYGFCYYHYWFNGKMLLEKPFIEVLQSGKPKFPFCLCWANENWTRAWDGQDKEILEKQNYNASDRKEHINWLFTAFKDPRYIRVHDKPMLLVYRTDNIPDLEDRINDWRTLARENGFAGLYLCSVRSNFNQMEEKDIIKSGFDAVVEFQPNYRDFPKMSLPNFLKLSLNSLYNKIINQFGLRSLLPLRNANHIYDYAQLVKIAMSRPHPDRYVKFPCVTPSWDNSARKNVATIIQNDDAVLFRKWLLHAIDKVERYSEDEKIVFINAWNEWAEGCHLEPDLRNGRSFLEAIRQALEIYMDECRLKGL
jgi:lipopolysaccharide biosynthesis protein